MAAGGVAVWLRAPLIVVMIVAARDRRADPALLGSGADERGRGDGRAGLAGPRARIDVLGGGITNRNFKVELDDGAYVLRVGGKDTELLGIDRRVEHEASLAAAAVGVGPEVVAFVEPEGYLVTRFVERAVVEPEAIREPEASAGSRSRSVPSTTARRCRRASTRSASSRPTPPRRRRTASTFRPAYERARETAALVERARGPVPERPCHNDLLTANFIDDGSRIRIVDWEYAGMGDVFFDLANFAVNNGLRRRDRRAAARVLRRGAAPSRSVR